MKWLIAALVLAAVAMASAPLFLVAVPLCLLYLSTYLWIRRVTGALRTSRQFEPRAFFGDRVTITVHVSNPSNLPIPWLQVHEYRPAALALPSVLSEVLHLGPGQHGVMQYTLPCRKRGFHPIGPLVLATGDVFGLARREVYLPARQYLLVYPRILSPRELSLPTLAFFGDLRSKRHLLGDPARVAGVRDYMAGDPLHDIHWRASAAVGSLQVKQYQPATTVQAMIFLDQHPTGYRTPGVLQAADFAVTLAATVANRLIEQRQEVGLVTNGRLALPPDSADMPSDMGRYLQDLGLMLEEGRARAVTASPDAVMVTVPPLAPAKGRGQLVRVLEFLARVEVYDGAEPFEPLIAQRSLGLPWGSTVVVLTGVATDALLTALHRLREAGLLVELIAVDRGSDRAELQARARALGIRLNLVWNEAEVEAISA